MKKKKMTPQGNKLRRDTSKETSQTTQANQANEPTATAASNTQSGDPPTPTFDPSLWDIIVA